LAPLALELMALLPKLMRLAMRREGLKRAVEEFGRGRCGQLVLFNDRGEEVSLWIGVDDRGEPFVSLTPQRANNEVRMHINTLKAILDGKLDPRVAYAHDLVEVRSYDGLPVSFHAFLWFSWFEAVKDLL